jgi:preprotein translocase subunit YajC
MFMIIFMIFYFLIIRPEGKKRRERQKMVSAVKKGDIVVTTGGLIGKVWRVDDAEVVMIIDKDRDVKAHFQKGAIYDVVKASEGAPAPEVAARPDVKSDQPSTR